MDVQELLAELERDETLNKRFTFESNPVNKNKNKGFLLAAADCETDPFGERDEDGNLLDVEPFCWGIEIENGEYYKFWGDNATKQFLDFLASYSYRLEIFAHNGGKFDWIFLLRMGLITGEPKIISGRLVDAYIFDGRHKIRDSYAMLPVPLKALGDGNQNKLDIDYKLMRKATREQYKSEILEYLKMDCVVLLNVVKKFIEQFGNKLTIGGAALSKLKEFHPFEKINKDADSLIRDYYIGGRVQCFELGEVKDEQIKVYDVNSMYPYVMADKEHPTFVNHFVLKNPPMDLIDSSGNLPDGNPYFVELSGRFTGDLGHFPTKTKSGLDFSLKQGRWKITHHELQMALKYNQFVIDEIHEVIICPETINFTNFVETYVADKIRYDEEGNAAMRLFTKLVLNSAYGKFGQNGDNFHDYFICETWDDMTIHAMNYELTEENEEAVLWETEPYLTSDLFHIYRKPIEDSEGALNDCFVAASITGASRAVLMEAIITADRPIYCDTDSVICKDLSDDSVTFHPTKLGAWDLEAVGDSLYLYGKKVYALYKDGEPFRDKKGKTKTANKGVKMSAEDIYNLVTGENLVYSRKEGHENELVFRWENEAPSYSLDGRYKFIVRELKHKKLENNC